jgi:hypothetical protein
MGDFCKKMGGGDLLRFWSIKKANHMVKIAQKRKNILSKRLRFKFDINFGISIFPIIRKGIKKLLHHDVHMYLHSYYSFEGIGDLGNGQISLQIKEKILFGRSVSSEMCICVTLLYEVESSQSV